MDLEDLLPAAEVGAVDPDVAVEAARADQGGVERLGPVGGGHDDDAAVDVEPVHRHEELIEGLVALVLGAGGPGGSDLADGVDLVDEDQARGLGLGLGEEAADTSGADADVHLHEVGAGEGEERHVGLARDGAGQQGLAGAGRADQQHALGDAAAEGGVSLGGAEEADDLLELLDRLLQAGDVAEGDRTGRSRSRWRGLPRVKAIAGPRPPPRVISQRPTSRTTARPTVATAVATGPTSRSNP